MVVSNDVVRDAVSRVLQRKIGRVGRKDIDEIIREILASIGVDVSGKMAHRTGYIAGVNRSLVMLI